jgi:hypothetical protein
MQFFPTFERSKLLPRLLIGLAVALVTTVGAYWLFITSEPYEFGTHFVQTDDRVTKLTGKPTKTNLRPWRGFRFSFGDRSGSAEMTIRSITEGGSFDVELKLEKRAGRWSVERAHVYPPTGAAVVAVESAACTNPCQ